MSELLPEERARVIDDICASNARGLETIGTSIRRLRLEVTGLDQATFARMCKLSTKSLYELESGRSNPTLSTLESVLRPFGLRLGLLGMQPPERGANLPMAAESRTAAYAYSPAEAEAPAKRGRNPALARANPRRKG
ncbi:MAG: hypothetical protein GAK43_01290 [Stenotrophomonas maltophilia]|nr:MAG: hypothetical protein GAK43_01290 [Stenotrophomonas maltophilia]